MKLYADAESNSWKEEPYVEYCGYVTLLAIAWYCGAWRIQFTSVGKIDSLQ